ncbi:MAG: cysteine desulfurase family protein [Planctomycetota bacterium]
MRLDSLFLDFNAGAPVHPLVLETWMRVARDVPANPSALHFAGRKAEGALEDARERVARSLGVRAREVVFTGGATEANNLALLGAARARARRDGRPPALVATRAEHPSVLGPLRLLQQEGHRLSLGPLDRSARADASAFLAAVNQHEAGLAVLQWANNETGAVQPLEEIAAGLPADVHLHVDATQGIGKLSWAPALSRADTVALSGHKFRAPKAIGVLLVREDALLEAVLSGGGQQRGLRPGTESPANAQALAHALELAIAEQTAFSETMRRVSHRFLTRLQEEIHEIRFNHPEREIFRFPNTLNLSFPDLDGRALLPACDLAGLAVSSGAACSSGSPRPSAVLLACGLPEPLARASLRISFGWGQEESAGERAAERLGVLLKRLYQHAKL